ncbi:MAG: hypothetical protein AAGJ46_17105 [Planctomycetota bacterium]
MANPYESPVAESEAPPRVYAWNRCPHCGEAAFGFFTKSKMGPLKSRVCKPCGGRVGVSWKWTGYSALAALAPVVVFMGAILMLQMSGLMLPIFSPANSTSYTRLVALGVVIGLPFLSGIAQVLVLTLAAPLVKRTAPRKS